MKNFFFFLTALIGFVSYGQSLNDYKYLVIKKQYGFQEVVNEYRLNSIAKYKFKESGFEVLFDDETFPEDLASNNCKAMYLNMTSKDAFMAVKLGVEIKDCHNKVLYTFPDGSSKEKSRMEAYNEALTTSLSSLETLNYKYNGGEASAKSVTNQIPSTGNVLSAKAITNGFQLVDNQGNVAITIMKTSNKDCFLATRNNIQGVLLAKDYRWFFEYYQNNKLVSEEVKVVF